MTPNSTEERVALLRRLGELKLLLNSEEQDTRYYARSEVAYRLPAIIEALTRTDNDVSGLVEALEDARGAIASLDVDALGWVEEPDAKWPVREEMLHRIDTALAKHRQSNGGAE